MRRIALIGDSHFDSSSRFDECVRIHDWIADDIAARGVDLVLHSGDVFERKSNPDERRAVAAWIQKVTEHAPLVIVRGNHDAPRDLTIFTKLDTMHEVFVEEAAGLLVVGGCIVGCMGWPTKSSVLALGAMSHEEGELVAGEALRNVLRGLGQQMADVRTDPYRHDYHNAPKILLAHAMVRGSKTSTGQPLVGCDLELGLEDLALAGADFYALGHIHMPQEWWIGDTLAMATDERELPDNVVYPGSPRRTAFGETEEKGYVIAEFGDDGRLTSWQRVPTPCTPMLQFDAEWVWEDWHNDPAFTAYFAGDFYTTDVRGAEVRFRYQVESDRREAAKAEAEKLRALMLEQGAVLVKIEEVVRPVGTARAPEVATALTLADKLAALWKARGTEPEPPRAERLFARVTSLQQEIAP